MPASPATFSVFANAFEISLVEWTALTLKRWIDRPRAIVTLIGAARLVFTDVPPRSGNTLSDSFSLRRYCTWPVSRMLVPRLFAPGPGPGPPPRPPAAGPAGVTVDDRF